LAANTAAGALFLHLGGAEGTSGAISAVIADNDDGVLGSEVVLGRFAAAIFGAMSATIADMDDGVPMSEVVVGIVAET